jgi:hypothetical protein
LLLLLGHVRQCCQRQTTVYSYQTRACQAEGSDVQWGCLCLQLLLLFLLLLLSSALPSWCNVIELDTCNVSYMTFISFNSCVTRVLLPFKTTTAAQQVHDDLSIDTG